MPALVARNYNIVQIHLHGHVRISSILRNTLLLSRLTHDLCLGLIPLELPRRHLLDKHLIQLLVTSARRLRLVNPQVHQADDRQPTEDEPQLAAEVEFIGVEQIRQDERPHGVQRVLQREANGDGLDAQAGRGDFADDGVGGRADGYVVPPAVEQDHADGGFGSRGRGGDGAAGHDEEDGGEDEEAPEGEVAAADAVDEVPGHDVSNQGDDLLHDLQLEAHGGGEACELHVVRRVAGCKSDAGERLDGEGGDGDDGSAEVGLAETFHVSDALGFSFDFLQRHGDERQLLLSLGAMAETAESAEGFLGTVLAGEPPGALGHEEHEHGSHGGEAVLSTEDSPVRPSGVVRPRRIYNERYSERSQGIRECSQASQHAAKR